MVKRKSKKQQTKKKSKKARLTPSSWDRELSAFIKRNEMSYYCNKCKKRHSANSELWKIDSGHANLDK